MGNKKNQHNFLYVLTNEWTKGLTGIYVTDDPERDARLIKRYLPGETKVHAEYQCSGLIGALIAFVCIQSYFEQFLIPCEKGIWVQCPVSVVLEQIDTHFKNQKKDFYEKLTLPNNTKITTIKELGEFCESWRRKNNISEKEIADLSNLSEEFIFQLENGTCNSQISDCLKVISLLGFDLFAVKRSL